VTDESTESRRPLPCDLSVRNFELLLRRKQAGADFLFVTANWIPHKFSFAFARKKILRNNSLLLKFVKTFFFRVSYIFPNPEYRILPLTP